MAKSLRHYCHKFKWPQWIPRRDKQMVCKTRIVGAFNRAANCPGMAGTVPEWTLVSRVPGGVIPGHVMSRNFTPTRQGVSKLKTKPFKTGSHVNNCSTEPPIDIYCNLPAVNLNVRTVAALVSKLYKGSSTDVQFQPRRNNLILQITDLLKVSVSKSIQRRVSRIVS